MILLLDVLAPLAVTLVAASVTHYAAVDSERESPAPIGGLFLGVEALLTVLVFAFVKWKVNLPDEERCRSDDGFSGSSRSSCVLGTAAVAGIPTGNVRRRRTEVRSDTFARARRRPRRSPAVRRARSDHLQLPHVPLVRCRFRGAPLVVMVEST